MSPVRGLGPAAAGLDQGLGLAVVIWLGLAVLVAAVLCGVLIVDKRRARRWGQVQDFPRYVARRPSAVRSEDGQGEGR